MATQRQVIIKADDYGRTNGLDPWRRFFDCALEMGYPPSVGVIAASLGRKRACGESGYLRGLREEYGVEIWNHSLTHADFTALPAERIRHELAESQKIIAAETGATPTVFGPPFNRIDRAAADAVLATGLFSGFYCFDGLVPPEANLAKACISSLEQGTGAFRPVRPEALARDIAARGWPDFLLVQVHPYYWSRACPEQFRRVLKQLQDQSYQPVGAADRLAYQRAKLAGTPPQPGRSLADNLLFEERALAAAGQEAARQAADSPYYTRMLRRGSAEPALFLRKIGFAGLPEVDGRLAILDVGAGVGNWAMAAALLPKAQVTALDREDRHLRHLLAHHSEGRIDVVIASLEDAKLPPGGFSGLVCNNTLSYLDLLDALERFAELLRTGGMVYLGLQNRLSPVRDALAAARAGDWAAAAGHCRRLADNEGAACGLVAAPFIRYWNPEELVAAATGCGLRLLRRDIGVPGEYGGLGGHSVLSGHLLGKFSGGEKMREALRSGAAADPLFSAIHAGSRQGRGAAEPPAAALLAQGRWREALALAASFGRGHDSFAFHVAARAAERDPGQAAPAIRFHNPLFAPLAALQRAVLAQQAEAVEAAARNLADSLAALSADELGYWL